MTRIILWSIPGVSKMTSPKLMPKPTADITCLLLVGNPLLAWRVQARSPLLPHYENTHVSCWHIIQYTVFICTIRLQSAVLKLMEKIFQVHLLFFSKLLEVLVKFPDFLWTSWPTFKIPDFFQTFQISRHYVSGKFLLNSKMILFLSIFIVWT